MVVVVVVVVEEGVEGENARDVLAACDLWKNVDEEAAIGV